MDDSYKIKSQRTERLLAHTTLEVIDNNEGATFYSSAQYQTQPKAKPENVTLLKVDLPPALPPCTNNVLV